MDFIVHKEERETLLNLLTRETFLPKGNKAAEWRLRSKRQANIVSELMKLGPLAVLSAGPLLVTWTGQLNHLERKTRWRETLEGSPMMQQMDIIQRARLIGAKSNNWTRLEKAIQNLGHNLCLSITDLSDIEVLKSFNTLKVWLVQHAFITDSNCDDSLEYIKWLGKCCQGVFLRTPPSPFEKFDPVLDQDGCLAPFNGPLRYISDMILSYSRRKIPLTYEMARQLSQIGNIPRGLPYPSKEQSKASVKETVETMTSQFSPKPEALETYNRGLSSVINGIRAKPARSHVSLLNSGKLESSRRTGGGASVLVIHTRKYTDVVLTEEIIDSLTGKFDQFGLLLIDPTTAELAKSLLRQPWKFTVNPTLGDLLYIQPENISNIWEVNLNIGGKRVPTQLAHLLNLTASMLMLEVGIYSNPFTMVHGIMCFETRVNRFKLRDRFLHVRADVSIESGLKTRLTTSGMAAFSHLSQLPANYMREFLAKDPFHRTGFEEPDKLWQVLKTYKKVVQQQHNSAS
jgi:hypothetical protein